MRSALLTAALLLLGPISCTDPKVDPVDPGGDPRGEEPATGVVTAEVSHTGQGVAGALVRLYRPGQHIPQDTSTTGQSGQASFRDLAAGIYEVSVSPPPGYSGGARRDAEVLPGQATFVAFDLTADAPKPNLPAGAIHVQVVDQDSVGLAGFSISITRYDDSVQREGRTDDTGWVFFELLPFGGYEVNMDLPAEYEMIPSYALPLNYANSEATGPRIVIFHVVRRDVGTLDERILAP